MSAGRAALASGLAFLGLTLAVALGLTRAADAAVLAALQSVQHPALDLLAGLLSLVLLAPLVAAVLAVQALRASRREGWRAFLPLAALVAATAVESGLKAVLVHPGPPHELARTHLPDWLSIASPELGNSYPSGHALRAAFLLGLALGGPRRLVVPLAAGAVATWLSRVYAADHWPSDVLGGVFLGLSAALTARALAARR